MNKKSKYLIITIALICIPLLFSSGCMKMAIRMSPEIFENMSGSVFEECDSDLAEKAIPGNLKILEGLLKNDPDNPELLRILSMGFCGYSILFVENDDKERASALYYRAATYGLQSIGINKKLESIEQEELNTILNGISKKNINSLLWATVSWSSWINLNLHKPAVLSQLGMVKSCIDKLEDTNPHEFYGLPYLLKGIYLSARSPMLGGNYEKSKEYFDNALLSGNRKLFLTQYYYARYYCVGTQNKELFISLLNEIIKSTEQYPDELCLINMAIRQKAEILLESLDDFFI